MQLTTPRLNLRPLNTADADALWPIASDERVPRLMSWEAARSLGDVAAFLASTEEAHANGSSIRWGIRLGQELIGMVALEAIVRTLRAWTLGRAELAYYLAPAHHNRGFATEAAHEVLRFGFEDLNLHKITVECLAENAPSRRVIEKLGFRFVGEKREDVFRSGRWSDHLAFELLAREWAGRRGRS